MSEARSLGDLQLAILREIWLRQEATVAEVYEALRPERGLAPTTIATMLSKMEKRRLVTHRVEGRQFVYRALVQQDDVERSMVSDLVERLFHGDPAALVNHLLAEGGLDPDELSLIRSRIADAQRREGGES